MKPVTLNITEKLRSGLIISYIPSVMEKVNSITEDPYSVYVSLTAIKRGYELWMKKAEK